VSRPTNALPPGKSGVPANKLVVGAAFMADVGNRSGEKDGLYQIGSSNVYNYKTLITD